MRDMLRYILLFYLLLFFVVAIAWRSWQVWRHTGVNPYALENTETAYSFVGQAFKLLVTIGALIVVISAMAPSWYQWLTPIAWLTSPSIMVVGLALLAFSLVWIVLAQAQMGASWRIGIDTRHQTELIQNGIFRLSRNPIFLGARVTLLGMLLVLPSAATLAVMLAGDLLIQVQVRLEEEHLARAHGERYQAYRHHVRRWL